MKDHYLTTFSCQLSRYRYKQSPFGAAPTGARFLREIDEIFKEVTNVFGIAGDILL